MLMSGVNVVVATIRRYYR